MPQVLAVVVLAVLAPVERSNNAYGSIAKPRSLSMTLKNPLVSIEMSGFFVVSCSAVSQPQPTYFKSSAALRIHEPFAEQTAA